MEKLVNCNLINFFNSNMHNTNHLSFSPTIILCCILPCPSLGHMIFVVKARHLKYDWLLHWVCQQWLYQLAFTSPLLSRDWSDNKASHKCSYICTKTSLFLSCFWFPGLLSKDWGDNKEATDTVLASFSVVSDFLVYCPKTEVIIRRPQILS